MRKFMKWADRAGIVGEELPPGGARAVEVAMVAFAAVMFAAWMAVGA